jgi:4-amino-4-deoxy-L-arabinose transferase-like glycosyltransferase
MPAEPSRVTLRIAAAVFTAVWFAMLFGRPLFDPDEGRYAEIPREMLRAGDWIIPHLDGLVYLEKPPLQYWATAMVYALVGVGEGTARLVTGLAGYGSLLLVFAIAHRLWRARAARKALLLTAGSILFVLLGHQLTLDMSLNFFLLATLAAFIFAQSGRHAHAHADAHAHAHGGGDVEAGPVARAPRNADAAPDPASRRWMLGCWAAMALAVLTKGLIGVLIPGFTLGVYVLWQRDFAVLRRLQLRLGVALFLAIAVPWFVLAARANREFLWFFFVREHLQRFLTPIEMRSEPWWFFVPVLSLGILPWLTQALEVLATGWRAGVARGRFDARRLLWIWSVFVPVFFSLSHSKLITYILPAIPTLALLCAEPRGAPQADPRADPRTDPRADPRRLSERAHLLAGAGATLLFALGAIGYASAFWAAPQARALVLVLRPAVFATSTLLLLGAATTMYLSRDRRDAALASLCAAWFAAAVAITVGAVAAQGFFSNRDAGLLLARVVPPGVTVYSVQTYEQSLTFYFGRSVTLVDYRDELALGQDQDPGAGIADVATFAHRWEAAGEAYAIMPTATWQRLGRAGLPMRELGRYPNRIVLVARQ